MTAVSQSGTPAARTPRLELNDLLDKCKRAASRSPMNNVLSRSNGHNRALHDSRNSTYNNMQHLIARIQDEQSPSLSVTRWICSGADLSDTNAFLISQQKSAATGAHTLQPKEESPQAFSKENTVIRIPPLAAADLAASEPVTFSDSPILQKKVEKRSSGVRASSPLTKMTLVSSGKRSTSKQGSSAAQERKRIENPVIIPVIGCCSNSERQSGDTLRLSSLSVSRSATSSSRHVSEATGSNSTALIHALNLAICKRHAAILKEKIDWQGYYLLILDSMCNFLGLARRASPGALTKVYGDIPDIVAGSRGARGKSLREDMFKSYMVLRGDAIFVESAPIQYTSATVGLII